MAGAEAPLPGQGAEEGMWQPPTEPQGAAVEGELGLLQGQQGGSPGGQGSGRGLREAAGLGSMAPSPPVTLLPRCPPAAPTGLLLTAPREAPHPAAAPGSQAAPKAAPCCISELAAHCPAP